MIKKPFLIKNHKYHDKRGFFQEIVLSKRIKTPMVFTALAESKKNVIRGLHFQRKNKQTKIIYVVDGKILDVAVNLRKKSKNFGKVYKFFLQKGDILVIPNFFAHGYECLSKKCTILYHLDNYRDVKNEDGIKFDDEDLKIKWITKKPILSKRDKLSNSLNIFKKNVKTL
tara:strand:+ start:29 stop:538 length:510 start_codon:yes stop_codon:yes gene_type:complete